MLSLLLLSFFTKCRRNSQSWRRPKKKITHSRAWKTMSSRKLVLFFCLWYWIFRRWSCRNFVFTELVSTLARLLQVWHAGRTRRNLVGVNTSSLNSPHIWFLFKWIPDKNTDSLHSEYKFSVSRCDWRKYWNVAPKESDVFVLWTDWFYSVAISKCLRQWYS